MDTLREVRGQSGGVGLCFHLEGLGEPTQVAMAAVGTSLIPMYRSQLFISDLVNNLSPELVYGTCAGTHEGQRRVSDPGAGVQEVVSSATWALGSAVRSSGKQQVPLTANPSFYLLLSIL